MQDLSLRSSDSVRISVGKYNDGIPDSSRYAKNVDDPYIRSLREQLESDEGREKIAKVKGLGDIAKELDGDVTVAQLALAWVARNPRVRPQDSPHRTGVINDF